jgi:hypothetical protein
MCRPHFSRERLSTSHHDSPLSALSKDCSFQRLTWYWLPPANWLAIRGWRRLSVQGVDLLVKCPISNSLRASGSSVETAHPSSLHILIIWLSCKLNPLIWGIVAWTLRAQWTSTSAVGCLWSLTGEYNGVGLSFHTYFLKNRISLEKPAWATSAYNPGKYWNSPVGCRQKGLPDSAENTSKPRRFLFFVVCLALFAYMPLVWHSKASDLTLLPAQHEKNRTAQQN